MAKVARKFIKMPEGQEFLTATELAKRWGYKSPVSIYQLAASNKLFKRIVKPVHITKRKTLFPLAEIQEFERRRKD